MQAILAGETDVKGWVVKTSQAANVSKLIKKKNHDTVAPGIHIEPRPPESPKPSLNMHTSGNSTDRMDRYSLELDSHNIILSPLNKIFYASNNTYNSSIEESLRENSPTYRTQIFENHRKEVASPNILNKTTPLFVELNDIINSGLSKINNVNRPMSGDGFERLEVFQDAFQRFIESFHKYKPFLSAVKYEYEFCIDELREKIKSTYNVQTELVASEQEHTVKIHTLEAKHEAKLLAISKEKSALEEIIVQRDRKIFELKDDAMRIKESTASTFREYEENRSTCITLTKALQRFEEEKRKYLAQDTIRRQQLIDLHLSEAKSNDECEKLRQLVQDMEMHQSTLVSQETVREIQDKIAKAESDLKHLDQSHKQLIERYSIIKSAIDSALIQEHQQKNNPSVAGQQTIVKTSISNSSNDNPDVDSDNLIAKVDALLQKGESPRAFIESMVTIIEDLKNQLQDGSNDAGGGSLALRGFKQGGATNKIQDDGDSWGLDDNNQFSTPWSHFMGLGFGLQVPTYLRTNGKIQNLFMSRREAVSLINEIFNRENRKDNVIFSLQFEQFLEDKYLNKTKSIETAYNLLDATRKYNFCSDCRLFKMILENELPESAWHEMIQTVQAIQSEVEKELISGAGKSTGIGGDSKAKLPIDVFLRILRNTLGVKSDTSFSKLTKLVAMESKGTRAINPYVLFTEKENGDRSRFLELLRFQFTSECAEFDRRITDCLNKAKEPGTSDGYIGKLRDALSFADPNKTRADINKMLARGCGVTIEEVLLMEAKKDLVPIDTFQRTLRKELLKKSGPSKKTT